MSAFLSYIIQKLIILSEQAELTLKKAGQYEVKPRIPDQCLTTEPTQL